jgi:hypothetical protein
MMGGFLCLCSYSLSCSTTSQDWQETSLDPNILTRYPNPICDRDRERVAKLRRVRAVVKIDVILIIGL